MMYLNLTEKVDKKELKAMIDEFKNSGSKNSKPYERVPNLGDIEKINFMVDKTPSIKDKKEFKSENDRVKELLDISDRARKYFYARDVNKELSVAEVADIKSKAREFGKRLLELGDS